MPGSRPNGAAAIQAWRRAIATPRRREAEVVDEVDEVGRPADGDEAGADHVLEDQVPADDPGRRARRAWRSRRCRRCRRPGSSPPARRSRARRRRRPAAAMANERMIPGPACLAASTPGQDEDADADDAADAERDEVPGAERLLQPATSSSVSPSSCESGLVRNSTWRMRRLRASGGPVSGPDGLHPAGAALCGGPNAGPLIGPPRRAAPTGYVPRRPGWLRSSSGRRGGGPPSEGAARASSSAGPS